MNAETIFGATITLVTAWFVVCFMWRNAALEWYRQSIFRLRDELFIAAVDGKDGLSLQDPVYRQVRDQLNARIRFANKVVPIALAIIWLVPSLRRQMSTPDGIEAELDRSPASKHLREVLRQANLKTFDFFCYISPFFWACSTLVFAIYRALPSPEKAAPKVVKVKKPALAEFKYKRSQLVKFTAGPRGGAEQTCRYYDHLARDNDRAVCLA